jgi:ABC-2 type transport system permease protein
MIPFFALVKKDLILFFRDRRSMVMSFIAPIAVATFLAVVLGGLGRPRPSRVNFALVDLDHSSVSHAVLENIKSAEMVQVTALDNAEEARELVRSGKLSVVAILPKDFGRNAGRGFFGTDAKPQIEILYDPSRVAERQMVEGVLTGRITEAVSSDVFTPRSANNAIDRALSAVRGDSTLPAARRDAMSTMLEDLKFLQESGGGASTVRGLSVPFTTQSEAVTARKGEEYDGVAHSFSGMGSQFILFMGIEAGVALLFQRERGLWKRFRSAPISKAALLGSRALSAAMCAFLILCVMFLFARVVFGVRIEGSVAGFLLVGVCFAMMTAAFGLMVASLGRTPEGTRPIAMLMTLLMVMLGGAWVPTFIFPEWLQKVGVAVPVRWVIDGLDAMTWRGLGIEATLLPCAIILGFAGFFGVIALWKFRWETD